MALKWDPRTIKTSTPTSTGVATFTVAGLTEVPVGAIIECTRTVTEGVIAAEVSLSRGYADGTDQYCAAHCADDGADPTFAKQRGTDTALLYLMAPTTGAALIVGAFDSFVAGGIKINFSTAAATARDLIIRLFFGDDTECKAFRVPAMVVTQSHNVVCGFEPKLVITDSVVDTDETLYDHLNWQSGVGGPAAVSGFVAAWEEHNVADADTDAGAFDGIAFQYVVGSDPLTGGHAAYLSGFDTTGFDVLIFPGPLKTASPVIVGLAVRPSTGRVTVDTKQTLPTSTGDQVITPGWRPSWIYVVGGRAIGSNAFEVGAYMYAGACDIRHLDNSCMGFHSEQGVPAANNGTLRSDQLVDLYSPPGTGHLWEGAVTASDGTSLTINWALAAATGRKFHRIIVEDIDGDASGTAAGSATAVGTLGGAGAMSGTAAGGATSSGALAATGALEGQAAGAASSAGELGGAGVLSGSSAGGAAVTGALSAAGKLAGGAAGASSSSGTMAGQGALGGAAAGVATPLGALEGSGALAGVSAGVAACDASLAGLGALSGLSAGLASLIGDLVNATSGQISGTAAGVAASLGALLGAGALSGTAAGSATASGTAADVTKGCFETLGVVARTILQESVVDLFPGTLPVIYSNELEVDGSGIPVRPEGSHVEADIVSGPNELVATTGRTHAYRKEGMLRARTFVVADSSWGGASDIAKRIEDAFTSALVNSVRFGAATTRAAGRAGAFFVLETDCPFVAFEKLARPLSAGDGNPDLDDCFAAIESRLWAQVLAASGIQVGWPNITFAPPNALHALVTHQPGTRIRQERGLESHTRPGITTVDLFAPIGDGDAAAVELGDTIVETMSSVRQDGVVLEAANLERLGRAGPYYLVSIACTWRADTVST